MKPFRLSVLIAGLAIPAVLMISPGLAESINFAAKMDGTHEVPPTDSKGTGIVTVTYDPDTKTMEWTLKYSGLTGEPMAAHFHGPAEPGKNADIAVPIPDTKSGSKGSATLTDEQANDLTAGKYYVNVHTEKHPDGEIRGQVKKASK
ncbi:hypothetical protein M2281_003030 [Mesorhizobium soli]|uniref:CHRD domain-containing protein n=1 Tax=Pseudaminobacter soli (ex Li et al. 2025) TaxID=1295366 RepID=UPI002476AB9A|nr:CHRD domain-containing protein [Mesorhizobium soli]MDH6232431.1 hypothetical protein [Mesorhizobium soli]